jgi:hypothetical protein
MFQQRWDSEVSDPGAAGNPVRRDQLFFFFFGITRDPAGSPLTWKAPDNARRAFSTRATGAIAPYKLAEF